MIETDKCNYLVQESIAKDRMRTLLNTNLAYDLGLAAIDLAMYVVLDVRCNPSGAVSTFRNIYTQNDPASPRCLGGEQLVRALALIKRDHGEKFMPLLIELCQLRMELNGWFRLQSGEMVRDREDSHLSPAVLPYLPLAFRRTPWEGGGSFVSKEFDFDRLVGGPIGQSICVNTTPEDHTVYGVRKGRSWHSRLVCGRNPEPTTKITVGIRRNRSELRIVTAYFGENAPNEPNDNDPFFRSEPDKSRKFWSCHALLWEAVEIQEGTETDVPPEVFGIK